MKKGLIILISFIVGFTFCFYLITNTIKIKSKEKTNTGELLTITLFNNDFEYYIEY